MHSSFYLSVFPQQSKIILSVFFIAFLHLMGTSQTGLSVFAGDDITACENDIFVIAVAQGYETVAWATDGDGTFASPGSLSTAYFPGPADIAAGQVELCITAFAGSDEVTDCLQATIGLLPSINIGVSTDIVCYDEGYTFDNVQASNYSFVQWVTVNGGGFFSDENSLTTTYFPNAIADYPQGCITIIVYAQGENPCNVLAEDQMELCFQPAPLVDLGGETHTVCYGDNYTFEEATAEHFTFLQWVNITGYGFFENGNTVNATYVPDPELDYPQGCIVALLMGEPISPCTTSIEEYVSICFQAPPEVDAGADATITAGESFIPASFVINQSAVMWESSGDGTFDDPSNVAPQYFPGIADKQTGSAVLTITAFSDAGCTGVFSDELNLTIITEQSISLLPGLNGFSSYVNTGDENIETLLAPLSAQLIYARKGLQVYYPQYGINTFSASSNLNGLILNLETPGEIEYSGTTTTATQIDLPAGWSILPVPAACFTGYQELLNQLDENLIIVAEIEGEGIIYPQENTFTLTALEPGKAYFIKMEAPAQFTFPLCD
jgi:hypothetical protein